MKIMKITAIVGAIASTLFAIFCIAFSKIVDTFWIAFLIFGSYFPLTWLAICIGARKIFTDYVWEATIITSPMFIWLLGGLISPIFGAATVGFDITLSVLILEYRIKKARNNSSEDDIRKEDFWHCIFPSKSVKSELLKNSKPNTEEAPSFSDNVSHSNISNIDVSEEHTSHPAHEGVTSLPKIRFCRMCGNEIVEGSVFCNQCGAKLLPDMKAQTDYVYATAANGLEVRIPRDKYPEWKKAQDQIRSGQRVKNPQTAERLASLMRGEKITKKEDKINMHILIWAGCLLVMAVIQVAINSQGILLGGIPTAALFFVTWWGALQLCELWDLHLLKKEAQKADMEPFEYVKNNVPSSVIDLCKTHQNNRKELKKQLKKCIKSETITSSQGNFLLGHYTDIL